MRTSILIRQLAIVITAAILFLARAASAQQHNVPSAHHDFSDAAQQVKWLEDPERDKWQKPDEVVKALGLKPGEVIVDIGAGSGYFTRRFAKAVAPDGKAIGVDIEPGLVDYMNGQAKKLGLANYEAHVVKPDDPGLAPHSVDIIFLCDAYHHIENHVEYLKRLTPALKQGGAIVLVDFKKEKLPVGPPPEHKVAREQAIDEFSRAGYRVDNEEKFLPYQYMLWFIPAGATADMRS
ncbi:MAG TPA: methyltransferase domain-containing protein [Candidatus Binataceae bacterium]|nr:methyltransferase domain-containing protein [Candidatus Binataceae bacterium]